VLSKEELELVTHAEWILTKNRILQKVKELLAGVQAELQTPLTLQESLPRMVFQSGPKISKGENYRGLPWLVLDYPRHFEKNDSFALRNFFWWGNFFSTTLYLSGRFKSHCHSALAASFGILRKEQFFICVNDDPWEHHFESGNYLALVDTDCGIFERLLSEKPFVKIAKRFSLERWDEAAREMSDASTTLIKTAGF
jgi:hypothetical protein